MSEMKTTLAQAAAITIHISPEMRQSVEAVADVIVDAHYTLDGEPVGPAGDWLVQQLETLAAEDVERILWLENGAEIEIDLGAGGVRVVARVS